MEKYKTVFGLILGVALALLFLVLKDYFKIKNEKLILLKNDLTEHYYDLDKLKLLLKEQLGDKYTGKIKTDFDNFVLTKVLNSISQCETEKNQRYDSFLSIKEMQEYTGTRRDKAEQINGRPLNDQTFYLDINHFFEGVTFKKVFALSHRFKKYPNLVIDLRDNSGGTFGELKDVAGLFLDKGKLIYQLNYQGRQERHYSNNGNPFKFKKIVILTNNNTASVSELFILALKENLHNVTIIGTRTYGKNISYSFRNFKDGSAMVFITGIMVGANQLPLDINGIMPDIEVGSTEEEYAKIVDEKQRNAVKEKDRKMQLDRALAYLQTH